jgi:hypothetical protein
MGRNFLPIPKNIFPMGRNFLPIPKKFPPMGRNVLPIPKKPFTQPICYRAILFLPVRLLALNLMTLSFN